MRRASGPGPIRLLIGSFAGLIAVGAALLMLPAATPPEQPIGWLDALFTATSAACVTGLVVRDTGSGFAPFGQAVILALIQLGGLGVMTFWLLVYSLFRGRVTLAYRSVVERTLTGSAVGEIWPLLRLVFLFTAAAEGAGAALLFARWLPEQGAARAAWSAVFHSISAFCNAGFGLYPDSLMAYAGSLWVNCTVMALIVLGGLGFFTVFDLVRPPLGLRPLTVHSKLALRVSAALTLAGAAAFWALEAPRGLAGMSPGGQLLASLFQSVTARTAGFNTVDVAALTPSTLFLLMLLMFVGGAPGSCAGGIKTTTLGVLVLAAGARLRGAENVNAWHRTLSPATVGAALAIAGAGVAVTVFGVFALLLAEAPGGTVYHERALFLGYFFETVSALGTVGLSTGVTAGLEPAGRVVVTLLMFLGRLGPLTVAAALAAGRARADWRYPEEEVMVG